MTPNPKTAPIGTYPEWPYLGSLHSSTQKGGYPKENHQKEGKKHTKTDTKVSEHQKGNQAKLGPTKIQK
jgi:hypothetical protein